MKLIKSVFKYIISFSLLIGILLCTVDFCCFDKNFYLSEFNKYNVANMVKTDNENLNKITTNLLDYLKDKNNNIDITYLKEGREVNVYQDIELIHMSDVKDLYKNVAFLKNILIIISVIGILFIFFKKEKIKKEFKNSLYLFIIFIVLIGISCIVDFNNFWTFFHQIFFTKNDYWLLDPRTCILVNLFNSNFFFDLCIKICLISTFIIFIVYILVNLYEKKIQC